MTPFAPPLGSVATGVTDGAAAGNGRVGIALSGAPAADATVGVDGAVHAAGLFVPCAAESGTETSD